MIFDPAAECMPEAERAALQAERLRATVAAAHASVPYYRTRLDAAGVRPAAFAGLAELGRLPFTTKADLREHYPFGLLAVPREQLARVHASSGTRGRPTIAPYTRADLDLWSEMCARSLALGGGAPGDVVHVAYGYGLFTGGLGLHYGAERLGCTVIPASAGQSQRQITLLRDLGAVGLACTPSYALHLAEVAAGSVRLRYGIHGAEPWTDAMRARIEAAFGGDAIDIYGLSEIIGPGVACECREAKDGLHIQEDAFLAEVVDPATGAPLPEGEVGELVLTTLRKEAMPLLRYRTGDLCSLTRGTCRCGRTTARMSRIKGRVDDMLIVRGVNVFPSEIEAVVLESPHLAPHYQVVLSQEAALDRMELQVEWAPATQPPLDDTAARAELAHRLFERLGLHSDVTIHASGALPRSEGKAVRVLDRRRPS